MTLTIQFPSTSETFDNRITCYCLYMLIAYFPTAALILIKKYIWVRIWIAKCDLRPLDFAQKSPQNAGNAISENQISKTFLGRRVWPRTPLDIYRHFGLTFLGAKSQLASPAGQKPACYRKSFGLLLHNRRPMHWLVITRYIKSKL